MASVFISHSRADAAIAKSVLHELKRHGFSSVFLDWGPDDGIHAGTKWDRELYTKLRACRALLALCSRDFSDSQWCFAEVAQARALGKRVFPIRLDNSPLPDLLGDAQTIEW